MIREGVTYFISIVVKYPLGGGVGVQGVSLQFCNKKEKFFFFFYP